MTKEETSPKLFISYSWSSPAHQQWVLTLASELVENGVDVILDKWSLKEGNDALAFMEKMVTDKSLRKVAMICDRHYSEKADGRQGGVGTETQILTPELYSKADQDKFVAVASESNADGKPYLPAYYGSRIYIDLSDDDLYASNFEQLLRWVYDKQLYVKPKIGKKPAFLSDGPVPSSGTSVKFRKALDSIRNNKSHVRGDIGDYFATFAESLENFRLTEPDKNVDEVVLESLGNLLPLRNEALEIFSAIAQFREAPETWQQLHRFFETLIPYLNKPAHINGWNETDFDNYRFLIHELFLHLIAALIKYERFDGVGYLLQQQYYVDKDPDYGNNAMLPFTVLRKHLGSFEYRNKRLQLRRLSLRADILKERTAGTGVTFNHVMQADFVLLFRSMLDACRSKTHVEWWPDTLVFAERYSGAFEIFTRGQSVDYFDRMKVMFGVKMKSELLVIREGLQNRTITAPRWESRGVDVLTLSAFDALAQKT